MDVERRGMVVDGLQGPDSVPTDDQQGHDTDCDGG
jgi:hypothetical protein